VCPSGFFFFFFFCEVQTVSMIEMLYRLQVYKVVRRIGPYLTRSREVIDRYIILKSPRENEGVCGWRRTGTKNEGGGTRKGQGINTTHREYERIIGRTPPCPLRSQHLGRLMEICCHKTPLLMMLVMARRLMRR